MLLSHSDIEINIKDDSKNTALQWCVDREKIETARVLLNDPRVDVCSANLLGVLNLFFLYTHQTALHWAITKDNIEFVELLMMNKEIDINQGDIIFLINLIIFF